jgi:hypothetical protein
LREYATFSIPEQKIYVSQYSTFLLAMMLAAIGVSRGGQCAILNDDMPASEVSYAGGSSAHPFTATEPYVIDVMGSNRLVPLYGASRSYDFSGDVPFVNPVTGVADAGSFQGWDPVLGASRNLLGRDMTDEGLPGRVEKRNGMTMVRYNAGDGITAGKCRTQVNSYPIPPRTHVRWELEVAFGSHDTENAWVLTPPMKSRVLFWQVKSTVLGNPSMQAVVDTDASDPTRSLSITFLRKGGRAKSFARIARVTGIPRNTLIPIVIEAFLDERETGDGGKGRMKVWVNGVVVGDVIGPTLTWGHGVHNWSMDMYLFSEAKPYRYTRASFWRVARMYVYP